MLKIEKKRNGVSYTQKWFAEAPDRRDALRLVVYNQAASTGAVPGFHDGRTATLHIDLSDHPEELLASFDKGTRYDVRRAGRDGVECETHGSLESFFVFFNEFARSKGLEPLDEEKWIEEYEDVLTVTRAVAEEEIVVMHSYLTDPDSGRVRLLHSASLFREEDDSGRRSLIGRANRLLHYDDMRHFRELGFDTYDLGGVEPDTEDPALKGINRFKSSFGGELVWEGRYVSLPLHTLDRARRLFE